MVEICKTEKISDNTCNISKYIENGMITRGNDYFSQRCPDRPITDVCDY